MIIVYTMAAMSDNMEPDNMENILLEKPYLSSNSEENNQISIVPGNPIRKINTTELTKREKQTVYGMYVKTYAAAGYGSRFSTADELFEKYPCMYALQRYYSRAFVLVQHKQFYNKISAVCHNDTPLGRAILFHIIGTLLNQPGTIIEASGAVSWILRKRGLAPMITNPTIIRIAIGLKPQDELLINPNYDINNKDNQYYTRIVYTQKNGTWIADRKSETLFGTPYGCRFSADDCTRQCVEYIDFSKVQGGRYRKKTYKKKRKEKKRKTLKRTTY